MTRQVFQKSYDRISRGLLTELELRHRRLSHSLVSRQNGPQQTTAQAERISACTGASLNFHIIQIPSVLDGHHGPTGGTVGATIHPRRLESSSFPHITTAMPSIDTVPDRDDKNLQTLPHDTQDDTGTSDDPAGNSQPEAQQSARPAHSQQKSTRKNFGIPQHASQVRGTMFYGLYLPHFSLRSKGTIRLTMSRDFRRISGTRNWVHLPGYGGHTLKNAVHLTLSCWKDGGTD